jgi:hypothetical protein
MATREDIKKIVGFMILAFPNYHPDLTEDQTNAIDVYTDLLGDLDANTLKLAVRSACAEPGRAFAPSAGEIRGMVVALQIKASGAPTAGEAWGEVMRLMTTVGCHGGTPDYSHPLIKKAVQAIGIENIGMSEDVMVERAHFLKIYAQLMERETENAAMLPEAIEYVQAQKQIASGIRMLTDKLAVKG